MTISFNHITLLALLLLITCQLTGCAQRPSAVRTPCPEVVLPDPPKHVEVEDPDSPKQLNVTYLSTPTILQPGTSWVAPADGGVVWKNRDLRGILYGLSEQRRWITTTQGIVDRHNRNVSQAGQRQDETSGRWWPPWK